MNKKVWTKPKLIVLFKGKPEEAVLQACKRQDIGGAYTNTCVFTVWGQTNRCSTIGT
ncbi:MAG: hypothetical protein JXA50_08360 [Deltaproteobacteria bacterium]|nr:hypothetical protein [Deltaproteobacteria bacterium]